MVAIVIKPQQGCPQVSLPPALCSPTLVVLTLARPVCTPKATPASRHSENGSLKTVRKPGQRHCPPSCLAQWLRSGLLVWSYFLSQQVSEIWNKYLNDHYQVLSQARIQQVDLLGKRFEADTGLGKWQFILGSRAATSSLLIHRLCPEERKLLSLSWYTLVPSSSYCWWRNWDRGLKRF